MSTLHDVGAVNTLVNCQRIRMEVAPLPPASRTRLARQADGWIVTWCSYAIPSLQP